MANPVHPVDTAATPEACDVLVIGGGPAGSTAAALLVRRGWGNRRRQVGATFAGDTLQEGNP